MDINLVTGNVAEGCFGDHRYFFSFKWHGMLKIDKIAGRFFALVLVGLGHV